MTGGRRSLTLLIALLVVVACGGRESGRPATGGQTSDTGAAVTPDTTPATGPDTGMALPATRDTSRRASDSSPSVAPRPPSEKPAPAPKPAAPKPEAPKPAPAQAPTPVPAESTAATPPVPAEPSAPLRDEYHQAPRDTVDAAVYEGWKQYNLNCARCHGEDVLGTTIAPHLIVSVRQGGTVDTKEKFIQTVCEGRPEKGMPAWCPLGLGIDKIDAIYQYVRGRSEGQISPGRPARRE